MLIHRYISKDQRAIRRKEREEIKKMKAEKREQYKEHRMFTFERYLTGEVLCCKRECFTSFTTEKKEAAR
tara:strand:+ start:1539 stop:1748 length:210 start_codon:yes stop_codon:yes gene_type:complete